MGAYKAQTESELEEFRRLTDSFINDYNATCQTEIVLIFKMAEALTRSTRAMHYQDTSMISIESDDPEEAARARKEFELYIRYRRTTIAPISATPPSFVSSRARTRKPKLALNCRSGKPLTKLASRKVTN